MAVTISGFFDSNMVWRPNASQASATMHWPRHWAAQPGLVPAPLQGKVDPLRCIHASGVDITILYQYDINIYIFEFLTENIDF